MQKAFIVAPHVSVLIAGSAEVGSMVVKEATEKVTAAGIDGVTPVMELIRQSACESYDKWFPTVPAVQPMPAIQKGEVATRPDLVLLVAGYDGDIPRIYSLPSVFGFPPLLNSHGFAVQGVVQYALYLLNRLYEPDRTVAELTPLAVYAITETAGQDGKVGGPVNVITIQTGSDGCQTMAPDLVGEIHTRNDSRIQALKRSFYEDAH